RCLWSVDPCRTAARHRRERDRTANNQASVPAQRRGTAASKQQQQKSASEDELSRRAPHLPTLSFPRKREPRSVSRETTHQRHHLDIAFNDCRRWVPAFAGMTRFFESRAKLKPTRRRDSL